MKPDHRLISVSCEGRSATKDANSSLLILVLRKIIYILCANSYGLPVIHRFPKFVGLAVFNRASFVIWHMAYICQMANNRSSCQNMSMNILAVRSQLCQSCKSSNQCSWLLLSICDKPADIDNHMGLFVGLIDFCYQSYRCAPLRVGMCAADGVKYDVENPILRAYETQFNKI